MQPINVSHEDTRRTTANHGGCAPAPRRVELPPAFSKPSFRIEHALGDDACEALVRDAEASGFGRTGSLYPPSYRDNDRIVRDDAALAAALFARLGALLPPTRVDDAGNVWRLAGLNTRFRMCRYTNGQSFRIH